MKQATSLITKEFNVTVKKEIESKASELAEAETLKLKKSEMEKKMALINKKLMETGTDGGAQGP